MHINPVPPSRMADQALHSLGSNALPTLLSMIRANDSALTAKFLIFAQRQHLITFTHVFAGQKNWSAASAFSELGPEAEDAIPALIQIYNQKISWSSQAAAAFALGTIGPPAKKAVPDLLKGLRSAVGPARTQTILALGNICADTDTALPTLVALLRDPDSSVQYAATAALGMCRARKAIPTLLPLLDDPNYNVQNGARVALRQINSSDAAYAK
jgi:HEAT repeat protein